MQRFFKLHWNALAIVIVLLTHSLFLTQSHLYSCCLYSLTDKTHTSMYIHTYMLAQMVPIRNTYIHTLCMSLPHPRTLPLTDTYMHICIERGTRSLLTFKFGFVSSALVLAAIYICLRLAGLFARFCFCVCPLPSPLWHQQHQHHHRFISFARTWVEQSPKNLVGCCCCPQGLLLSFVLSLWAFSVVWCCQFGPL